MSEPDLLEFLRARLDEDEQAAQAATAGPWYATEHGYEDDAGCEASIGTDPTSTYGWSDVVRGGYEGGGVVELADAPHIARHDPTRVLAEVGSKRRILAECGHMIRRGEPERAGAEWILKVIALPFADHPDYRPEWSPDASPTPPGDGHVDARHQ